MQYQNMLIRIKALQLKEHEELYEEPEVICPASSWREALKIGVFA